MEIHLNPKLTTRHIELVLKYLSRLTFVAGEEWPIALEAFDLLRSSIVNHKGMTYPFTEFYNEVVDYQYADAFIAELLQLADMGEAPRLVRTYNQRIIENLIALGVAEFARIRANSLFPNSGEFGYHLP